MDDIDFYYIVDVNAFFPLESLSEAADYKL